MRAIFCIDPGQSTGVAWGIVNEQSNSMTAVEAVRQRLYSQSTTITGREHEQIRQLYARWTAFKNEAVRKHCMDPSWIDLVIEDFVLFPGEKPGRATTTPERIAWGFEGYRMAMYDRHRPHAQPPLKHYTNITWQKSGDAHRFTTRTILTNASAWIVGKEHERSAYAHMIVRTTALMSTHSATRLIRARG